MLDQTYWAAKSGLDLANEVYLRIRRFYKDLPDTVMYRRWAKAYRTRYGLAGEDDPFDISRAMQTGDRGQLVGIKVNHSGSLQQRALALVSQTIPEFEIIPANSDYASLEQASFGRKLLNYFMDMAGVGAKLYDTADMAGTFGEGVLEVAWDPHAGPLLETPDPLIPTRKKSGDLSFRVYSPLDLPGDRYRQDQDHAWRVTRRLASKWDLAARYPTLADDILGVVDDDKFPGVPTNTLDTERGRRPEEFRDDIPLYTFYHRKSDALPNGKIALLLNGDVLLYEGNLPYDDVPLVPICPGKILRTPYGDSNLHHILNLQDVLDNCASAIASNNVALANHIIMIPKAAEYSYSELGEGLAALEVETGPDGKQEPKALSLNASNESAQQFVDFCIRSMETVIGIPATLRGNPQANIQSGAFAALVAQQALEYVGAFQYSFQQAVGRTGNLIIDILQQYADQKRTIEIAGQSHSYQAESFTRAKLERIHRVTVKSGNPAARTPAFAIAMADSLLAKGALGDPQTAARNYISLVRTGEIDTVIEDQETESMNIRRENELIARGENPPVVATDAHRQHIKGAKSVLSSPEARANPSVAKAALDHIQEHINALRTTDPALLNLLGETPLAPQPGPAQPPPQVGAPGKLSGPQPGPSPVPPAMGGPGRLPEQPELPNNPMTGGQWTPQDGARV